MLKWAGVFLVLLVIAGVLGFVLEVAGAIFKFAFVVCLILFAASLVRSWWSKRRWRGSEQRRT